MDDFLICNFVDDADGVAIAGCGSVFVARRHRFTNVFDGRAITRTQRRVGDVEHCGLTRALTSLTGIGHGLIPD